MRKKDRQRFLFSIHWPKPKPLPKLNADQAADHIQRTWRLPDGSPIPLATAQHWASTALFHFAYERAPIGHPPKLRTRPERPTAHRIDSFLLVETD